MARTYPHVSVVGVDLSPASLDLSTLPINLKFEIEDLNHGLSRFHSEFDVVHMRCVSGGILDFEKAMESVQRCAKPGGLVLFIDGEAKMYAEDQLHPAKIPEETARNGSEEGSWFAKVIRGRWFLLSVLCVIKSDAIYIYTDACKANQIAGADIARAGELIDFGLWNSPFCDPTTAYSGCVYIPIGPWPQGECSSSLLPCFLFLIPLSCSSGSSSIPSTRVRRDAYAGGFLESPPSLSWCSAKTWNHSGHLGPMGDQSGRW